MMKVPMIVYFAMMAFSSSIDATKLRGVNRKLRQSQKTPTPTQQQQPFLCAGNRRQLMGGKGDNRIAPTEIVDDLTMFNSSFYVAYNGPTGVFAGNDVTTVQTVMRDTYNEAVGCIAGLTLDSVVMALQTFVPSDNSPTRRHLATRRYTLLNYYTVSGTCRSCATGTKLFNDAVRRRILTQVDDFNSAGLTNLNANGIVEVTSVSATSGAPLVTENIPEDQVIGGIDVLVEGIIDAEQQQNGST